MRYRVLVVAMALCVLPCSSLAQTAGDPLRIGDRLRVLSEGETAIGVVTVVGERGFDLVQGRLIRSFAYDHIQLIERSDGMRRQWGKGALYGGLAGIVLGAVSGYTETVCDGNFIEQLFEPDEVSCGSGNLGYTLASGLGMGGSLGIVGAGVGWLIEREAWVNITLPQRGTTLGPIFGYSTRNGRPEMVLGIRIGPSGVFPRYRPRLSPIRTPSRRLRLVEARAPAHITEVQRKAECGIERALGIDLDGHLQSGPNRGPGDRSVERCGQ